MSEGDYRTAQEAFWAGDFGTSYIERNMGDALLASNIALFSKALSRTRGISSCVEFGANVGMNLRALRLLFPNMSLYGVEINQTAAAKLRETIGCEGVIEGSILDVTAPACDLAVIKGVLIHMSPDILSEVYEKLVGATKRFLLVAEYYNPTPVAVEYRGVRDRLFKRDFAGEILEQFPEMALLDYGFIYRRDPVFPQDDVTWFLLEKIRAE